jgi:hypothetical protein
MGDITNPRLLYLKGGLFVLTGLLASGLILLESPSLRVAALLAVAIWCFARAYYFAFYVVEHYVDPGYRFAGDVVIRPIRLGPATPQRRFRFTVRLRGAAPQGKPRLMAEKSMPLGGQPRSVRGWATSARIVCYALLAGFVALGLTDLLQTYALLRNSQGTAYESNPLANAWLTGYGWHGLAAYKAAVMALVVGVVLILSRRHPRVAAAIAGLGCAVDLWVVLYTRQLAATGAGA